MALGASPFLSDLEYFESGGRNISNTTQGTSSGQAQGYDQITTGTWREFAPQIGVDLSRFPTAISAPLNVQRAVAENIPLERWDPKTLNYLRNKGYSVQPNLTLGQNIANNGGNPFNTQSGSASGAGVPGRFTPGVQGNDPFSEFVNAERAVQAVNGRFTPSQQGAQDPFQEFEAEENNQAAAPAPQSDKLGYSLTVANEPPPVKTAPAPITAPAAEPAAIAANLAANTPSPASSVMTDPGGGLEVMNSFPLVGPYLLKAGAASNALVSPYFGGGAPGASDTFSQRYANELALQKQQMGQFEAQYPGATRAARIGGSILGGAPLAMTAPGLFGVDAAMPWTVNAASGMATGAALSGADTAAREYAAGQPISPQAVGTNALLGGAVGGTLPIAGSALGALGRGLTGGSISADDAALASVARDKYNIPLGLGDLAEGGIGKHAFDMMDKVPGSGASAFDALQQGKWQNAVLRTINPNAKEMTLTPNVMNREYSRIGGVMDDIASRTTINLDDALENGLIDTISQAGRELPEASFKPVDNLFNQLTGAIDGKTGTLSGQSYQAFTQKGGVLDRALHNPDSNVKNYAVQIKGLLDDALQRSAAPGDAAALRTARNQYKNLMTVEPLVANMQGGGTGNISPGSLAQAINNNRYSKNDLAYGDAGDLGELAQIGYRFLKPPQTSGTAERSLGIAAAADAGYAGANALAGNFGPALKSGGAYLASILGSRLGRSQWLTNPLINRSLGDSEPNGLFRPLAQSAGLGSPNALLQNQ